MSTTAAYSTSTWSIATNQVRIARIAAATRVRAARLRVEAIEDRAWEVSRETGQLLLPNEERCFICNRSTDHSGEHTPEQIAAWRAVRTP